MSNSRYPRVARVNEVLREVIADEITRLGDDEDSRLRLATVTGVEADPEFRTAAVYVAALGDDAAPLVEALERHRTRIQSAIAKQVKLRRTPHLTFAPDPGVAAGRRVDDLLRHVPPPAQDEDVDLSATYKTTGHRPDDLPLPGTPGADPDRSGTRGSQTPGSQAEGSEAAASEAAGSEAAGSEAVGSDEPDGGGV